MKEIHASIHTSKFCNAYSPNTEMHTTKEIYGYMGGAIIFNLQPLQEFSPGVNGCRILDLEIEQVCSTEFLRCHIVASVVGNNGPKSVTVRLPPRVDAVRLRDPETHNHIQLCTVTVPIPTQQVSPENTQWHMLKFNYKKSRLNFMSDWQTVAAADDDEDWLQTLAETEGKDRDIIWCEIVDSCDAADGIIFTEMPEENDE
ncbi:hypothetical protein B0H16DRAFT_1474466 [Mycena metata]|uniref:Uncharacterized protein n=1 Tax=Mycena metata TaxID=1033252 RepID=A0AAD7HGM7_9AGAR|nr:hypothetical protein B0H16DRAFT_1474466 [Mycena metata]